MRVGNEARMAASKPEHICQLAEAGPRLEAALSLIWR